MNWIQKVAVKAFGLNSTNNKLQWTINQAGEWIYPEGNSGYIVDGYKSLPNVYSIISLILNKSTIVPFEIFKITDKKKYQKYKASLKSASNTKDYARAFHIKREALDKVENTELELLLENPNDYQSLNQLWWELDGYKLLTGNSILYGIPINTGGKPKELHSIPATCVELNVKGTPFDPEFHYKVSYLKDTLPEDDVYHFRTWNPIGDVKTHAQQFWGQSPLMACRRLLGRYADADETQGFQFKNQGPGGMLSSESKEDLSQEQAQDVQDRFNQQHTGSYKAGSIMVSPKKLNWTSFGLSAVDLNIVASKGEMLGELCNAFHVPIGLFTETNSTENNMIEGRKQLITDAVIPLVEARKQVLQKKLLPKYGDEFIIEFDYTVFHELQDDINELADTYAKMFWTTPNEKRFATGHDRIENELLDKIYMPSGYIDIEDMKLGDIPDIDEDILFEE